MIENLERRRNGEGIPFLQDLSILKLADQFQFGRCIVRLTDDPREKLQP
jgi:hypothetical protein